MLGAPIPPLGSIVGSASTGIFFAVDCPSESLCVAAGSGDAIAASTEPAAGLGHRRLGRMQEPGSYSSQLPDSSGELRLPGAQIRGVSCPNTGLCVAVTRLGSIFTSTDPAGGVAAWSGFQLQASGPRAHLYSVSCPTTGLCVAVGTRYLIASSTDPFDGPPAAAPGSPTLQRPTVKLTHHPPRVIRTRKARVQVSFRFREIGLRALSLPEALPRRPGRHFFAVKVADPGGPAQAAARSASG